MLVESQNVVIFDLFSIFIKIYYFIAVVYHQILLLYE